MNYEEFLSALRKTPREWFLDENQALRIKGVKGPNWGKTGEYITAESGIHLCPGLFVYNLFYHSSKLMWPIAAAADNDIKDKNFDPQIRKDLLSACGLDAV